MQQHHGQDPGQYTAQGKLCTHAAQLLAHALGGFVLRRQGVLRLGFQLRLSGTFHFGSVCGGHSHRRFGRFRLRSVQRFQRQAHGILFFRLAGSGLFVLCRAEHLENRLFLRLFRQRFRVCRSAGKHHRRQFLGGLLCSLCRGFFRLCRRLCRRGLHLWLRRCLPGL